MNAVRRIVYCVIASAALTDTGIWPLNRMDYFCSVLAGTTGRASGKRRPALDIIKVKDLLGHRQ